MALIGVTASWPLRALAQAASLPVIGYLNAGSSEENALNLAAFREGLKAGGFVEQETVSIEYRWAEGQYERVPALTSELIGRHVKVIVAPDSTLVATVAKAATSTIPIIFRIGTDPVEVGLVPSLNHPGGNLTGVTTLGVGLGQKRLELLRELVPAARSVALLVNPVNPAVADATSKELQAAVDAMGLQLHIVKASTDRELDAAFAKLGQLRAGGLIIATDTYFNSRNAQTAALALQYGIPAIYHSREFAVAGGLMGYGGSVTDAYRQVGIYASRILKGEKPADLPVQQSTKVELVINMKSAKVLGLTVPLPLLGRANEVIE